MPSRVWLSISLSVVLAVFVTTCAGRAPNVSPNPATATAEPASPAAPTATATASPVPATLTPTSSIRLPAASPIPASTATSAPAPQARRPNIVFILTDDQELASVAYMPKLKSLLIDQGVWFDNFFVNVSLCCPSRATSLRGQYSQNTGIMDNLPPDGGYETFHANGDEADTVAVWLQRAGYRTMLAGKYLNGYPNTVGPTFVPPGWTEWYSPAGGDPYREFDYTLNENGVEVRYGTRPEDYGTDVYARKTVDFIRRSAQAGLPFFAYVAVYAPHNPATPAPRHAALFPDARAPRTANFNEADVSTKPAYLRALPLLDERQVAQIDQLYRKRLQSLQAVDDLIESVVDTLRATGRLDDTYIFFSSDNGFHLGNHRLDEGKATPYEEDIRVPLVVRGPGVPQGARRDQLAGNIDLAVTWAGLAGAEVPGFVDGRSLAPLLHAQVPPATAWRQCYLLQHSPFKQVVAPERLAFPPELAGLLEPPDGLPRAQASLKPVPALAPSTPGFWGLRTQRYTYVEYNDGQRELYDILSDPDELHNIYRTGSPGLLDEFAQRLAELKGCRAAGCRAGEDEPLPAGR